MTDQLEPNEPVEPLAAAPPQPAWTPSVPKGPYKPSPLPGILTGLGLGVVLAGTGYGLALTMPKPAPAPAATTSTPEPAPAATPGATPASEAKTDPAAALTTQVEGLGKRIDELQKQVADLPKPPPPTDLKPIEAKVDALAKQVGSAAGPDTKGIEDKLSQASAAVADAQTKLDALAKSVDAEKSDVAALKDQVKSLSEAKPAAAATAVPAAATPAASATADADYAKAVDLFKKNQFGPARDAFVELETAMPDDARVWYYAALSTGFATSDWNNEPVKLVAKGKELEKAGKPAAADINSTFADLPAATKAWLDAYRSR